MGQSAVLPQCLTIVLIDPLHRLPQSLLKKTGFIQGVKFSVVMRNLWTLTNYTGYDPEYDSSIIYGMYPNTRQYSFGLELVF